MSDREFIQAEEYLLFGDEAIRHLQATIAELSREVESLNKELAIERGLDKLEKLEKNDG